MEIRSEVTGGRSYKVQSGASTYDIRLDGGAILLDGKPVEVEMEHVHENTYLVKLGNRRVPVAVYAGADGRMHIRVGNRQREVRIEPVTKHRGRSQTTSGGEIKAPMPGQVLRCDLKPGDAVHKGDSLLVLEAMKMENELRAPIDGVIEAVHVREGTTVARGALLVSIKAPR